MIYLEIDEEFAEKLNNELALALRYSNKYKAIDSFREELVSNLVFSNDDKKELKTVIEEVKERYNKSWGYRK